MAKPYKKPTSAAHKPTAPHHKPSKPGHKNMPLRKHRTQKGRKLPKSGGLEDRLADKEL